MWDLKVCRGCLLTEAEAKLEPFNKTLKMGYQSLTGLEIKDGDGYPTYFCLECCVHIKKAWVFRRKSRRAFYAMKEIMIIRREISLKDIQTINRQKTHLMSPFSYWNIKNNVIYNIDKTEDEEGSMVAYTPVIDNLVFHTIEVIPEIDQNIEEKEIKPVEEIIDNVEVNENENGGDIDLEDVFKDFKEESSSESEIETAVLIEPIVANNAKKISYAYDVRIYKVCKALCNTNITVLSESEQKTIHEFKSKVQPFVAAKYRCAICQIKFDEIEQLMKHRQDHNDNHGEYSCNICQNRFISDEGLEIHTRECHLYQYSCITCSQIMFTVSEVIMHNEEQHPNVFKNEKIQMGSLRQHFDLVTLSPVEMYKRSNNVLLCFWCDKHFLDRNDWAEHVSDHKGAKRYFCDICLKSNNAISNLQRHMELFHMKQYKCKQCSELISSRKKLKRHIKNGHCVKKGSRKCNYCDVITVSEKKMLSHVWHKHFSEMYTYLCNICGRGYSSLNSLYRHQIVTHKYISPMDPKLGDPEHACSSCNVQFNTRRAYETHAVRANHPEAKDFPNVCVPCRKIFDTEEECRDHHLNVPKHYKYPRPCDICNEILNSEVQREKHHRKMHADLLYKESLKSKLCDLCGTFLPGGSIHKHMKRHNGDLLDMYECTRCDAPTSWPNVYDYIDHVVVSHTRKPYHCSICRSAYRFRVACRDHILKVHRPEKLYTCEYCQEQFYHRDYLIHHCKTNHNITVKKQKPHRLRKNLFVYPHMKIDVSLIDDEIIKVITVDLYDYLHKKFEELENPLDYLITEPIFQIFEPATKKRRAENTRTRNKKPKLNKHGHTDENSVVTTRTVSFNRQKVKTKDIGNGRNIPDNRVITEDIEDGRGIPDNRVIEDHDERNIPEYRVIIEEQYDERNIPDDRVIMEHIPDDRVIMEHIPDDRVIIENQEVVTDVNINETTQAMFDSIDSNYYENDVIEECIEHCEEVNNLDLNDVPDDVPVSQDNIFSNEIVDVVSEQVVMDNVFEEQVFEETVVDDELQIIEIDGGTYVTIHGIMYKVEAT